MIQKSPETIGNIMIAGAAGAFFLSTLFATVVFDKPSVNTTVADQEIQLAVQLMPEDQHVEVWMDAILPMHIVTNIVNISKVNEDGSTEKADLTDVFPMGGKSTVRGVAQFKINLLDRSLMPNIDNVTQDVIPMAYVKEAKLNRAALKFAAVTLKYFRLVAWLIFLSGFGLIGAGAVIVYLATNKPSTHLSNLSIVQ